MSFVIICLALLMAASSILNASQADTSAVREELLQPGFEQPKPQPDEINDLSPREVYYNSIYNSKAQQLENKKTKVNVSNFLV